MDSIRADDSLTDIICHRMKTHLRRIIHCYKANFGKTLLDEVKSETSGDYRTFLVQMLADPAEADADSLFQAMDGWGTTEKVLTEIIMTSTNDELKAIKKRFEEKHDRPLIDWVNSEVSGDYKKLLVKCLQCQRKEVGPVDPAKAQQQCDQLVKAAQGWGTDEAAFIDILGTESVEQIDEIQRLYEMQHNKSLVKLIEEEVSGDFKYCILLRLETKLDAQCRMLKKAMDGAGTDEWTIARVLGGSSKTDAQTIHSHYDAKYSADLVNSLSSELGGNLKKAVLKWLEPPSLGEPTRAGVVGVTALPRGAIVATAQATVAPSLGSKATGAQVMPPHPANVVPTTAWAPPNAQPGFEFYVRNASGTYYPVTVPESVAPGQSFQVYLPA